MPVVAFGSGMLLCRLNLGGSCDDMDAGCSLWNSGKIRSGVYRTGSMELGSDATSNGTLAAAV